MQSPNSANFTIEKSSQVGKTKASEPEVPFLLRGIEITHNTLFDTPTLLALVADAKGKNTSLPELAALAARITDYYRDQGYPLSRAIIPAQTISEALGIVSLRVVEARYGAIEVSNSSRVPTDLLQSTLAPLKSASDIHDPQLKNVLLLLSDLPGLAINAIYKPGREKGTSDLTVNATALPSVTASAALDNYGNAFTGQERLSASITLNNPLHRGDTLNASLLHSGPGLGYWRLAYEATVNGQGSRTGASFSSLNYAFQLSSLHASGSATVQSLWGKHPLVRSPDMNLYAQAQYDGLRTQDRSDGKQLLPDRALDSATLSLAGDVYGSAAGAARLGTGTWKLAWTGGQRRLDGNTPDASQFAKWNLNLAWQRSLSPQSALHLSYAGQRAQSNLDPSQKLSAGGPHTVRAYAVGAVSGDSGDIASAEWQQNLSQGGEGRWQAVAFMDRARITVNHVSAGGPNTVLLHGAGVGLNWSGPANWTVRSVIAAPLGNKSALLAANKSVRAWLELRKAV